MRSVRLVRAARVVAPVLATAAVSCTDAVTRVSDGPAPAGTKVSQLGEALAARFTNPERSGRFESARRRLVSGSLNPSSAFEDTSIWLAVIPPATRVLSAQGTLTDRGYRFEIAPDRPVSAKLGDTRHVMMLRRLPGGDFRWNTGVDFSMGTLTAADAAEMLEQLLTAGNARDPATLRLGARTAFPRSTAVLSRLFAIDSLTLRPGPQGSTVVNMAVGIRTESLRPTAPHFADYVARYVEKSRYRVALADRGGALYFEAFSGPKTLNIRYRVRAGTVVSYLGPPRPLPDSLRLSLDLLMHVKMFDVGWRNLVADFTIDRGEHFRSWTMAARTEPEWHLPLITARLLRGPLQRPFQGSGASLVLAVVDSAGGPSLITRRTQLEVKESAILRFLGGMVSRIFDDLDAAVEKEEAAYLRELMTAFQADVRALPAK